MDNKVRFVRVWFPGSIRSERRGLFLRVVSDAATALSGYEVDAEGEEIQPSGYERRLRVIAKSAITKCQEYAEDRTYGTLQPKEA